MEVKKLKWQKSEKGKCKQKQGNCLKGAIIQESIHYNIHATHTLMDLSTEPLTSRLPFRFRHRTVPEWPARVSTTSQSPLWISHTRIVLSYEPLAILVSSNWTHEMPVKRISSSASLVGLITRGYWPLFEKMSLHKGRMQESSRNWAYIICAFIWKARDLWVGEGRDTFLFQFGAPKGSPSHLLACLFAEVFIIVCESARSF